MFKHIRKIVALGVLGSVVSVALLLPGGCSSLMPEDVKTMMAQSERFALAYPDNFAFAGDVHYAFAGDPDSKTTLVFVHGSPGSWGAHAAYLSDPDLASFFMISPDRLGYGDSRPGETVGDLGAHAASIQEIVKERPGRKIWIGHSFGAPICLRAAVDFPEEVDAVLLLAGAVDPALEQPKWIHHLGGTWAGRKVLSTMWDVTNQECLLFAEELDLLAADLTKVQSAVTILHGKQDRLAKVAHVDFMKESLAHTQPKVVVLEEGDHFVLWNQFEVIKGLIGDLAR